MVSAGQEEENGGLSGGYFGVILRSVTIDGWVVISILMVMAVISITVMANKARYISRVAKANAKFLAWFEEANYDVMRLEALAAVEAVNEMDASVLYRICDAGSTELAKRMGRDAQLSLTPQAVATIKANLDRISAYESQKLNAQMVLLTIAISGGPFLGLLGTVVGVMITFAAIAATGDVNINAIAPGIAAALVATVAGLAVAIPALFGYNYLITRIKDMTGEMHAYTDEFVTRLAEAHPPRSEHKPLAAE
jgi:biopolymer transport protein ExbB